MKLAEAPQLENWKKLMEVSTKNILSLFTDRICDRKSLSIIFIGQYLPIKFDRKKKLKESKIVK